MTTMMVRIHQNSNWPPLLPLLMPPCLHPLLLNHHHGLPDLVFLHHVHQGLGSHQGHQDHYHPNLYNCCSSELLLGGYHGSNTRFCWCFLMAVLVILSKFTLCTSMPGWAWYILLTAFYFSIGLVLVMLPNNECCCWTLFKIEICTIYFLTLEVEVECSTFQCSEV